MKRIFLLFTFIIYRLVASSQEIAWQKTIGGNDYDWVVFTQQTSDGGYIIGGNSTSDISNDKNENRIGSVDIWIVKTDSLGNIQWQNTIGGSLEDRLTSMQQTTDGGYILGGYSESNISGDKTENSKGTADFWLVKIDSSGSVIWDKTIGGNSDDVLQTLQQTNDGGYILGGCSNSNISGDKSENFIGGLTDYWIVKTDPFGNIQWENTVGGTMEDKLYSVQQTNDGGYMIGGTSASNISGDKTEISRGGRDYWILKMDSLGNLLWQNTFGGNTDDYLERLEQTSDGGYILGGSSTSGISGDKTENKNGYKDMWIVKIDNIGNILWQNSIGGSHSNNGSTFNPLFYIQQTQDNGFILGGSSNSDISGDKSENDCGIDDFWILKTDSMGVIQWQNTIGGNNYDIVRSIVQTNDDGYIICGWSSSNISGDKTDNSYGGYDYWLVKITEKFNTIKGNLFIDLNANNVHDSAEYFLENYPLHEQNTGRMTFTQPGGAYNLSTFNAGNFIVQPNSLVNYTATPVQHNILFSGIQQTDSLNDFAFQPNGAINDLQITITPQTRFRPGFDSKYIINYKNIGTVSLSGTIVFYPDSGLTYVTSSFSPISISTDSITWQTPVLLPFDEGDIYVTVDVSSAIASGTILNSFVRIDPRLGDPTPSNNQSAWEVTVTSSYDPNDILVSRSTLTPNELISPDYLEYIIRFQNTGTDTAFTIKINNPLPLNSDLSTFELIESSHPVILNYMNQDKAMWFQFDNILLPDSNVNEPMSHGYIRYKIKPLNTIVSGEYIRNKAHIYFDFNVPVNTNTALTEITFPLSIFPIESENYFSILPNPTNGDLKITYAFENPAVMQLEMYNAFGQKIKSINDKQISSGKNEIYFSITEFPNGIYYLSFLVDGNAVTKKIVKM